MPGSKAQIDTSHRATSTKSNYTAWQENLLTVLQYDRLFNESVRR